MISKPEWLPDWRDASQYPAKGASAQQWAWQFLRRNAKYQRTYNEYVRPFLLEGSIDIEAAYNYEKETRSLDIAIAKEKGENSVIIRGPINAIREDFGLTSPQDPACADTPFFEANAVCILRSRPSEEKLDFLSFGQNDAYILFRLDLPLQQQLNRARQQLLAMSPKKPKTLPRFRPEAYQGYLRLLDGDLCEVSISEMAKIIFPGQLSGPYQKDASNRAFKSLRTARSIMKKDYRAIAWHLGRYNGKQNAKSK